MKDDLDILERSVGAKLRQAMPPISPSPDAVERMRPKTVTTRVVQQPLARGTAGPWWKRLLVASLAAAVAGTAFLSLTPAGRAMATAAITKGASVWTGLLGHTPAVLFWVEQPMRQSTPPGPVGPEEIVGTVAEAAAKVGFEPVQASLEGASLEQVKVVITDGGEYQSRWVALTYAVAGRPYQLVTMVHYRKLDGAWQPISQSSVAGYAVSEKPTRNVRTVQAGGTEGLAFEVFEGQSGDKEFWRTDVTWLPAGNQRIVRLHGSDPGLTEAVAQSAR